MSIKKTDIAAQLSEDPIPDITDEEVESAAQVLAGTAVRGNHSPVDLRRVMDALALTERLRNVRHNQ